MFSAKRGQDFHRGRYEPLLMVAHAPSSLPIQWGELTHHGSSISHPRLKVTSYKLLFFHLHLTLHGYFPCSSRPALGPTQSPVQWVPGVLSPGVKPGRGVMLTTHPHLVPRLSMSRSYTSSPPCASMACSGTALLLFSHVKWVPCHHRVAPRQAADGEGFHVWRVTGNILNKQLLTADKGA
jgi:hypothetical protein